MRIDPVFGKNILTMFTGNAIAFVIPVLLYPFLSRIFTTADYAPFGLYFSLFGFLEIASAGRYDFGVVLPELDEDAINLVAGGLIVAIAYALIILLLVFGLNDIISVKLNNAALAGWLYLLPVVLFLISVSKLFNGWLIRIKKFKASSINKASQKVAEGSAQLVFGMFKTGNGLILGDLFGRLFNAGFSVYQSLNASFDTSKISRASIAMNLKRYIELPKYGIGPSMLNTLCGVFPVLIISSYYSTEASGSFNFSRIILAVPFAVIATGISQVLMQRVSDHRNQGLPVSKEIFSIARILLAFSVAGALILFLAGPDLFELVFGVEWRLSGEFSRILVFSTAVSFVVSPFSTLLVVLGRIKWLSFWQTFYFLAISVLWVLPRQGIIQFLVILVAIDVVSYLIYGAIIYQSIRVYEQRLEKSPP